MTLVVNYIFKCYILTANKGIKTVKMKREKRGLVVKDIYSVKNQNDSICFMFLIFFLSIYSTVCNTSLPPYTKNLYSGYSNEVHLESPFHG